VGSEIAGRLLRVSNPRHIAGTGFAAPAAGKRHAARRSTPARLTVDDEGRIKAKGVSSGDKVAMIAGTGTGAIVGTIAAGGKGLLCMIGGGATLVHWLTKRHMEVPAGTELIMEISRPMTVISTPMSAGN
jgi:hypothetical protein